MKHLRTILIALILTSSASVKAQYFEIDYDPDQFVLDISNGLQKIDTESAKKLSYDFKALWSGSKISNAQRDTIILITKKLRERRLRTRPYFVYFFTYAVYAINNTGLASNDYSRLLKASLAATETYGNRQLVDFFLTLNHIFARGKLYSSNYYNVSITGGKISFDYSAPVIEELPPIEEEIAYEEEPIEELPEDDWGQEDDDTWASEDTDDTWATNDDWATEDSNDSWDAFDDNSNDTWDTFEEEENLDNGPEREVIVPAFISREIGNSQPSLSGPIIKFENVSFLMVTPYDSVTIENTSGALEVNTKLFVGQGGVFNWPKGIELTEEASAEFSDYNFKVNIPYINAKKATLNYPSLINVKSEGDFIFKSVRRTSQGSRNYPYFRSYGNDINLEIPGDDMTYRGGLTVKGDQIIGANYWDDYSVIEANDTKGRSFKAISTKFVFIDSLIRSDRAQIAIYHDSDSIVHPIVRFDYDYNIKLLTLLKDKGNYKHTQYYSSFFRMNFNADMVRWDLNSDSLDVSVLMANHRVPAVFESDEYYNEQRYAKYTGLWGFHPITAVVRMARRIGSSEFYLSELISEFKLNPKFAEAAMNFLEQNSFINFDQKTKAIKVRLKSYHYQLANRKKKDYDYLLISSISTAAANGTFRFDSGQMQVRGVEKLYLTPDLDITIEPDSGFITVLEDRDLIFDGTVNSGDFQYKGKDFNFSYNNFLIDMPTIDSIRIQIDLPDSVQDSTAISDKGKTSLNNHLTETSGTLYINSPDNKAGLRKAIRYPYFVTTSDALVYFDGPEILGGAYDKSIRFLIPPMEMDSLAENDASNISFPGTLFSGGILPQFQDTLRIQPDNSLGFTHTIPDEGYALYKGSGKLYNELSMSGDGFRSNGRVEHQTTTVKSEDFIFYMDSVTAHGSEGKIEPGTFGEGSYPQGTLGPYRMKWLPQKDSMYIANIGEPFDFYHSTAQLDGEVNITAKGMFGSGTLTTRGSVSESKELAFKETEYSARHAKFEILTDVPDKPAMAGDDISLNFDLTANIAEIHPEELGVAAISFPYAQMKTSITNAIWDLEGQTISMTKPETVPIEDSYFYTTREELDSLAFNAASATYDINTYELDINGIPWIIVADAKIIPENNHTTILENATLQPFTNAEIVIDTLNEYHYLDQGQITILSRNKFEGTAKYKVAINQDTSSIDFNEFNLVQVPTGKKSFRTMTVSGGEVLESSPILIAPGYLYKGGAKMFADRPTLELDGFVKVDFKRTPNHKYWIKHQHNPEETSVVIDFESAVTELSDPLTAGLFYENDLRELYPKFLDYKRSDSDNLFFQPKGAIKFDTLLQAFKIEEPLKETGESYAGRTFIYDETNQTIVFEGPLNFIHDAQNIGITSAGVGTGKIDSSQYEVESIMVFDYDINSAVINAMTLDVMDIIDRLGALEAHGIELELMYNLANLTNDATAKSYENSSLKEYLPLVNVATAVLAKTVALSNVKMHWSNDYNSWYNTSKLGLSNIGPTDVNAKIDGFIEIRNDSEIGEVVNLFIMVAPETWYYFAYEDNRLEMFSSNRDFNSAVDATSNIAKAGIGEYATLLGDENLTLKFINEFRKKYFGIDEPFNLQVPMDTFLEDEEFETIEEDDDDGF